MGKEQGPASAGVMLFACELRLRLGLYPGAWAKISSIWVAMANRRLSCTMSNTPPWPRAVRTTPNSDSRGSVPLRQMKYSDPGKLMCCRRTS